MKPDAYALLQEAAPSTCRRLEAALNGQRNKAPRSSVRLLILSMINETMENIKANSSN